MWIPRRFLTVVVTFPRRFSNRRGIQGRGIFSDSTTVFYPSWNRQKIGPKCGHLRTYHDGFTQKTVMIGGTTTTAFQENRRGRSTYHDGFSKNRRGKVRRKKKFYEFISFPTGGKSGKFNSQNQHFF